jgi:hypothetical protein
MWIPWWEMNWSMSGHDRWHWKAPSLTDHCLRSISRVWLDRHWWEHGRQNGTRRILVGWPILFFQMWHFGPGLKAKRRREALFALCQGFYLEIALFDRISVYVCVCGWLWDSGPLDLALWKILVGKTSSHWCACRAECKYWDLHSWCVCIDEVVCREVLLGLP